jgi:hypothetical protein
MARIAQQTNAKKYTLARLTLATEPAQSLLRSSNWLVGLQNANETTGHAGLKDDRIGGTITSQSYAETAKNCAVVQGETKAQFKKKRKREKEVMTYFKAFYR